MQRRGHLDQGADSVLAARGVVASPSAPAGIFYMVVLRAEDPTADRERPMAARVNDGTLGWRRRRRCAQERQARIQSLAGLSPPEPEG